VTTWATNCVWDEDTKTHLGAMPRDQAEALLAAVDHVLTTSHERDPAWGRTLDSLRAARREIADSLLDPELQSALRRPDNKERRHHMADLIADSLDDDHPVTMLIGFKKSEPKSLFRSELERLGGVELCTLTRSRLP
jgi:hypothetical protein